jgi:hypothetical protein
MLQLHSLCGTLNSPFLWYTGCTNRPISLSSFQKVWFYVCEVLCDKIYKRITLLCFSCLYSNPPGFIPTTFRIHQKRTPLAEVGTECTYGQLHMYIKGNPVEIQTPIRCNLTGNSMNAPPTVLSPNSILPLSSSRCTFFPTCKNSTPFKNIKFYFLNTFLKVLQ